MHVETTKNPDINLVNREFTSHASFTRAGPNTLYLLSNNHSVWLSHVKYISKSYHINIISFFIVKDFIVLDTVVNVYQKRYGCKN